MDSNDLVFMKLENRNMPEVYNMLFGKIDKSSESYLLLGHGSPYYHLRLKKECTKSNYIRSIEDLSYEFAWIGCNVQGDVSFVDLSDIDALSKEISRIEENIGMKFDHIVMNPPYKKDLHLKILTECIKHLKEDGDIVNLSPARWIMDPLAKYKKNSDYYRYNDLLKKIESVDIIDPKTATDLFGSEDKVSINTHLGIYKITMNSSSKEESFVRSNNVVDKVVLSIYCGVPTVVLKNNSKPSFFFVTRFLGNAKRNVFSDSVLPSKNTYGVFKDGLYKGKTPKEIKDSNSYSTWGNIDNWDVVAFDSNEEAENAYVFCQSKLFRYCVLETQVDVHVHLSYYPWIGDVANPRTGLIGFKSDWTDDDIYKVYGLTDEEIKTVEDRLERFEKTRR